MLIRYLCKAVVFIMHIYLSYMYFECVPVSTSGKQECSTDPEWQFCKVTLKWLAHTKVDNSAHIKPRTLVSQSASVTCMRILSLCVPPANTNVHHGWRRPSFQWFCTFSLMPSWASQLQLLVLCSLSVSVCHPPLYVLVTLGGPTVLVWGSGWLSTLVLSICIKIYILISEFIFLLWFKTILHHLQESDSSMQC